jgi:hypothetical protein
MVRGKKISSRVKTKSYEEVKRHWGDVEVIDSQKDLRVFVQPEDVASAKAKDPGCCVFAQACKRQFAATKVLFWKSVAYVELPGPDGARRVERFSLSPSMRSLIESFDRGNPVPNVAGFELKKPRPSLTFGVKLKHNRAHRQRKKHALLNGTAQAPRRGMQGKGKFSKPAIVVDLEVRSGKGRVQFKNVSSKA